MKQKTEHIIIRREWIIRYEKPAGRRLAIKLVNEGSGGFGASAVAGCYWAEPTGEPVEDVTR